MFGPRLPTGSQAQPYPQLGASSAEIRGNDPVAQGCSSSDRFSPYNINPSHSNASGSYSASPLKGPPLPSGFDPSRGPGIAHTHGTNIPFTSSVSQGSEADLNIPKSIDSGVNEKDITALLSRPDIASSIAEDLLKQLSQSDTHTQGHLDDKFLQSELRSSQDKVSIGHRPSESSSNSVGIHSNCTTQDLSKTDMDRLFDKLEGDIILKSDTESTQNSLPKLNVHMTGEQICRMCKGFGKFSV